MISLRWDCIAIVWGYECLAPTPIELMFPRSLSSTSRNPVLPPPIQTEPINIFTRGQPTLSPAQNRRSPPSSDGPRLCRQNIFLGRRERVVGRQSSLWIRVRFVWKWRGWGLWMLLRCKGWRGVVPMGIRRRLRSWWVGFLGWHVALLSFICEKRDH
jgi:hypothetical protein